MDDSQKIINKEGRVVFSKTIKAGKRIYYLDVRKNRRDELFLTITESRKISNGDGVDQPPQFEKHKLFLYKEDFDCFMDGMEEVVEFVKVNNTVDFVPHHKKERQEDDAFLDAEEENVSTGGDETITFNVDF